MITIRLKIKEVNVNFKLENGVLSYRSRQLDSLPPSEKVAYNEIVDRITTYLKENKNNLKTLSDLNTNLPLEWANFNIVHINVKILKKLKFIELADEIHNLIFSYSDSREHHVIRRIAKLFNRNYDIYDIHFYSLGREEDYDYRYKGPKYDETERKFINFVLGKKFKKIFKLSCLSSYKGISLLFKYDQCKNNLQHLTLKGKINEEHLKSISILKNLKNLTLLETQFGNDTNISLNSIKSLDIRTGITISTIPFFAPNLIDLNLNGLKNDSFDLNCLLKFPMLKHLYLELYAHNPYPDHYLEYLRPVSRLTQLTKLQLTSPFKYQPPVNLEFFKSLTKLEFLSLSNQTIKNFNAIEGLQVKTLDLSGDCQFNNTFDPLYNLPKLKRLYLPDNFIFINLHFGDPNVYLDQVRILLKRYPGFCDFLTYATSKKIEILTISGNNAFASLPDLSIESIQSLQKYLPSNGEDMESKKAKNSNKKKQNSIGNLIHQVEISDHLRAGKKIEDLDD